MVRVWVPYLLDKDFVCKLWIGCDTLLPALEDARFLALLTGVVAVTAATIALAPADIAATTPAWRWYR